MPSGAPPRPGEKDAGLRPGDLVAGHYRVERVIGSGGMGVVVAARDERNGDEVAVKVLRSVDDTRAVERFFREARAMGKLDSEHVVRVRDAGSDGKKPYLVMDRLTGVDLAARTRKVGPLSPREATDHVIEACEALSHAHAKGIVHRDVKPSNLFLHTVGDRTILKILDFGISKVQTRDVWERTLTTTDDGGVLGSPPYMSPEQVRDPKAVDPRSDVWSLGVVLYKILSGSVPFDGDSVGEVFAKVLERPYPSLRVTTDLPPELDDVVRRCLEKDRENRWSHVGELALALAPFASPDHAAMAPRIAQRMHDEGPTLERPSQITDAPKRPRKEDPATLSLAGPPVPSTPPPPSTPSSPARVSHVPVPVPVPVPASRPPPPLARLSSAPTTDSVSLDVLPSPSAASPKRPRLALLLGAIGVAAGIGIGLLVRGASGAGAQPAINPTASSFPAPADPPASPSTPTSASATVFPTATATATSAASAKALRPRASPTKKPGSATAAPPSTAPRPELQPSPYATAP
jgi:serine/threonine-protein kinase